MEARPNVVWTAPSLPDRRRVALTTEVAEGPRVRAPPGVRTPLTELDKLAPETRIVFVRPPVHASVLPAAGSPDLAMDKACNDALSAYSASRPRTVLLIFRSLDPFFSGTEHFWDSTHYRSVVAQRIERDVAEHLTAMDR